MSATSVRLRFFASARAATGVDEVRLELPADATIADALSRVASAPGQRLDAVLARCSFLVDGVATTDRMTPLGADAEVDVMPPLAGG